MLSTLEGTNMDFHHNKRKYMVSCANCGGLGHVYKTCNHPTISYGFICFKLEETADGRRYPRYLMVQRKDSLSYVEFIRGKYDLENRSYIMHLFSNMTPEERNKIKDSTFDDMWRDMWCKGDDCFKNFNKEYQEAYDKFKRIKKGYFMKTHPSASNDNITFINIEYFLNNTVSEYSETEWGFPKGRRNVNEDDMNCALREFKEETGINPRYLDLYIELKPLEEIFSGSNKKRYKHVYYIASVRSPQDLLYDIQPSCREIKDVKWFTYEEAQQKIRNSNIERKELLKRLHQIIMKNT